MASVTPTPALTTEVVTGTVAVTVFPANIVGGYITNPFALGTVLYINPIDAATTSAVGNTFALQPGQTWTAIPGQSTPTTVNSPDSAHTFSAIYWI
jgi:hypothetical protein